MRWPFSRMIDRRVLIKQIAKEIADEAFECGTALDDVVEHYPRKISGAIVQEAMFLYLHYLHRLAVQNGKKSVKTALVPKVAVTLFEDLAVALGGAEAIGELGAIYDSREREYEQLSFLGQNSHDPDSAVYQAMRHIGGANGISKDALFEKLIVVALLQGVNKLRLHDKVVQMEKIV